MDRVHLFSNGEEWLWWQSVNCDCCTKDYDSERGQYRCDLYQAIDDAASEDGTVSTGIADRLQVKPPSDEFPWRCGEFDALEPGTAAE